MNYSLGKDSSIHMGVFVTGDHIHIGDNVLLTDMSIWMGASVSK